MPIYEYNCTKCGQHIEVIRKFSDPPLKECEKCGGSLSKRVSHTSFQLKGSGWYKDGYSTPAPKKAEGVGESAKAGAKDISTSKGVKTEVKVKEQGETTKDIKMEK